MTSTFSIETKGFCDVVDITRQCEGVVAKSKAKEGICLITVAASTCGITTIEYEDGAVADLKKTIERIIPQNQHYEHNKRWGDGNGFSHIRSSLFPPTLSLSISDGELIHGTWQQIVLIDFDNRSRTREVRITIVNK